jgi:hypothetical protein
MLIGSQGIEIQGIVIHSPPHLRAYDPLTMNIPFTGSAKGQVVVIGPMIPESSTRHIRHERMWLGTDSEPPDDSCGRPLSNSRGKLVAVFRNKSVENMCSATMLERAPRTTKTPEDLEMIKLRRTVLYPQSIIPHNFTQPQAISNPS